jgi:hypothetical protein
MKVTFKTSFKEYLGSIIKVACLLQFFVNTSYGQDSLSTDIVRKFTYSFTVKAEKLEGRGWDSLRSDIAKSQFILLGENHSSPKLSELTALLLREIKPLGYHHFIIETGPIAPLKVKEFYNKDEKIFGDHLYQFLSTYKLEAGSPPAEFIAMKKDVGMYKSAIENGFSITCIDREYYSSSKYLFQELLPFCATNDLKRLHKSATDKLDKYQAEDIVNGSTSAHVLKCQNDQEVQLFLNNVSKVNEKAMLIVNEIRKCHYTYGLYASKRYKQSEEARIANYKKNFGNYYYKSIGNNPSAFKALIKMGNMHTGKADSDLGFYDIGNMIYQLACLNGTKSLHIENMRRFRYNKDGVVMDFLNDGYEVYPNIIQMASKENWVAIDLAPLRELLLKGKIKVKNDERSIIMKNDWVLHTPLDDSYEDSLNYK